MKLEDYINMLEDLKSKYGNVDLKINKTYECYDLSISETYSDPEEPFFDKEQKCVVVYSDYVSFD